MLEQENFVSDWLERLQRESWQLELLISGFSIFLLVQAFPELRAARMDILFHSDRSTPPVTAQMFLLILQLACIIMTFNLILHVVLRGIWIGTVGLRSVKTKTNLEGLNYSDFFTEKLKGSVRSLDELIIRLDNICSVVFAFTFLLVFMLFSLFMYIFAVSLFMLLLTSIWPEKPEGVLLLLLFTFIISILSIGLIYLIDTLSLGFFKKYNFLSRIYYPIYKFLGFITLAFIYRGIYYNLLSRLSKNRIRIFLIPYLLLVTLGPIHTINYYTFFPDTSTSNSLYNSNYEDMLEEDGFISRASIPSKIIRQDYLPLFIRYNPSVNETLLKLCDDYTPSKESIFISGIKFDKGIQINDPYVDEEDPAKLLGCLTNYYQIYVDDSLYQSQEFYFHEHRHKDEKGIFTMLDVQSLAAGKHQIKIFNKYFDSEDQLKDGNYTSFPFWLQK